MLLPTLVLTVLEDHLSPAVSASDNVWMLLATVLVVAMHLGFAAPAAGPTQAKDPANVPFRNPRVVATGLHTYADVGFSLMLPGAKFAEEAFGLR